MRADLCLPAGQNNGDDEWVIPEFPGGIRELTPFVREVMLPGGPDVVPCIDDQVSRFRLAYRRSAIDRWGVFAAEDIPARRRVTEYTGERISHREVTRRSLRPRTYIFWVSARVAIDGAVGGSGAEFINQGCAPNLIARVSRGHVHLVSQRAIAAGDELLLDYRIRGGGPLVTCRCGAPNCRGYLNHPDDPRLARDLANDDSHTAFGKRQ